MLSSPKRHQQKTQASLKIRTPGLHRKYYGLHIHFVYHSCCHSLSQILLLPIDKYTTNQITYRHWSLKLDWSRCSHFVVGILPQHSTHISTGFFVQSTCLLEFYSRKSIICTQIMLRIKEKNKKISFKLIGIALSKFLVILGRILCYILVVFEQDIVFGAYLTLQAESREDVDVF